ncbi:helix-turn-helix domain-containing protein [Paenactinomyces guangxiensis]|uniref:Tetratricopeptide repeat protein n=1 Tax=Paenactinomyces guangxiensis TaxID=1490290 RepID=A0A7W1WPD4_9BACL|nr:helix-turn-helix domain-containing protein [Paenactinomyces guangxiensis]MBA4493612.1 tetratricopeptide repeat protein [Paenactinomyces guangxiensis]MBH8590899.1 tetratricopeptide repeat protein [Paenactinomyces guangxiensis]
MKTLALHEMGEVIRKVRKERGLRLEDLADENISPATVSNIERGVAHVSPEKISYLLEKLDLPMHKLPEMLVQEQEEIKKVKFKLLTVTTLQKIGHIDEALDKLEELNLDDNHPFIAHAYYYKGKCYMSKRKWKQAERALYNSLRISQQNPYKENNMEAASYLLLGLMRYFQNDLEQALEYTNSGINAFVEDGENEYIKGLLYQNKGVYLQRLGRVAEGMRLVQDIWDSIPYMQDIGTVLSFYWLRAEFSRLSGLTEEAIEYAMEGIELSIRNEKYDSLCDLWTVLGSIYTSQKEWNLAETSFSMALKQEGKFPQDSRLTTVYSRMGILYMKENKMDEAYQSLLKAIKYAEKFDDSPRLSSSLLIMGDLCQLMNKMEEAISYYEKALQLARKHDYKDKEIKIWFSLARCWDGRDEEEFQKCMRNMYNVKKEYNRLEVDYV